jgi:hypothetical protein
MTPEMFDALSSISIATIACLILAPVLALIFPKKNNIPELPEATLPRQ